MDNVEKLLKEIKEDPMVWIPPGKDRRPIFFSGKFLDTVGEIFEKHGFGTAKVYLLNQSGRDRIQALGLKRVLEKMEKYPEIVSNRAIGRYVIKTLEMLKKMEV